MSVIHVEFNPHGNCNICLGKLISKRWRGKNNVIAILHSSSSPSCSFHEKCIRAWAGRHGENSNKCTACLRQISDVTFYKCGRNGAFKQVIRQSFQVYEHPIETPAPARRIRCWNILEALAIFHYVILVGKIISFYHLPTIQRTENILYNFTSSQSD